MSSLLVFNRVWVYRRLEIQSQSCWYFRISTHLCELLPSNLLSGSPLPPPLPKVKVGTVYTDNVLLGGGGGGGVLSCVGDHILQEFNTLFLTKFRTSKIALSPQTKT
jgi:hypothetical protein